MEKYKMFETTNQINIINDVSWNHPASKARPALDLFFRIARDGLREGHGQHGRCITQQSNGNLSAGMIWVRLKMGYKNDIR
jgi:cysteine synthase